MESGGSVLLLKEQAAITENRRTATNMFRYMFKTGLFGG